MRPLTQDERNVVINAVQTLTGRLGRALPADARQVGFQAAVKLIMQEYRMRFGEEETPQAMAPMPPQYAPPVSETFRRMAAPPAPFYPMVTIERVQPNEDPFR